MGLRLQLSLVLVVAFSLSLTLLGVAVNSFEKRQDRLALERDGRNHSSLSTHHPNENVLSAAFERSRRNASPFRQMFSLYAFVTGTSIGILTYFFLTFWIVRPVEKLTRASQLIAEGRRHVNVDAHGAREVKQLASAFNDMATQLWRERDRLEQRLLELERTTHELRATQQSLIRSEKLASVGRLSAGIAHEIGNPLAAILGLVELMQAEELGAEQSKEFLGRVHRETQRIHRIIRDLLDFSRQGVTTEKSPSEDRTALGQVVEEAVRLIVPQKDLRDITIERRFFESTPNVAASSHQLTQVVLNLLLNATDAVAGHGTILVEVMPHSDAQVLLRVTDSGPGIPANMLETMFEPFVTTKPAGHGTGLGLAVCRSIVESMQGNISAHNAKGGGACFEVVLPIAT